MPAWMPCESCCPAIQPYIRSPQRPGRSPVFTEGKEAQRAPSDQEQKNWENLKISATKPYPGNIKKMKDKIDAEICPGIGSTKGCCPLPLLWKGEPHETDEKITGSLSALLCAALLVGILPSQAASYEIKSDVDSVTTG